LTDILMIVVAAVLAITLHEAAHGYAAWALGDDTAKRMGRLSLNPLRHVDRVGTILLPGFLLISQLLTIGRVVFMFGWAKPVPVAAWRFPNPRRGMMLVAAAGPAMNFLLAWLAALSLHALPYLSPQISDLLTRFVAYFVGYNLILGLFNLLPIPPLDGGRIVVGLLPEAAALQWAKLERAGIAIVLLVMFLLPPMLRDLFHIQFDPVRDGLEAILPRAMGLVEWLAGLGSSDV
jgi:Zn-dependent protease